MEPTLTQNCALYYAQHKTSKGRAALFKKFRAAARKQAPDVRQELAFGELFIVRRLHPHNGRWAASLVAIMDPLTFASSQNEESDFAAERRWENEGGNPGQLQQLLCDDRKEDATTGPAPGTLKAFCYQH
jgi:hypothetical protein